MSRVGEQKLRELILISMVLEELISTLMFGQFHQFVQSHSQSNCECRVHFRQGNFGFVGRVFESPCVVLVG